MLDEAHIIKNHNTAAARAACSLHAMHRFALTGTPVQNQVSDLWSVMQFLIPEFLGDLKAFREQFIEPIRRSFVSKKEVQNLSQALTDIDEEDILERKKFSSSSAKSERVDTSLKDNNMTRTHDHTLDSMQYTDRDVQSNTAAEGQRQGQGQISTICFLSESMSKSRRQQDKHQQRRKEEEEEEEEEEEPKYSKEEKRKIDAKQVSTYEGIVYL